MKKYKKLFPFLGVISIPFLVLFLVYYFTPNFDFLVINKSLPRVCDNYHSQSPNDKAITICTQLFISWYGLDEPSLKKSIIEAVKKSGANPRTADTLILEILNIKEVGSKTYLYINVREKDAMGGYGALAVREYPKAGSSESSWRIANVGQNWPDCASVKDFPREIIDTCILNNKPVSR